MTKNKPTTQTNTIKVRTALKAGGLPYNHNRRLISI
jgi:hypothetical protein